VLEFRISPENPTEMRAVLQLVQALAGMKAEPCQASAGATPSSAPVSVPPAPVAENTTGAEETVTIEIPWPPRGKPDPTFSAQQVLEALQDYARVNGAAALKEVLDRFGARRVSDIKPEHYAELMTIARGELA
jgi:hypothetical protein